MGENLFSKSFSPTKIDFHVIFPRNLDNLGRMLYNKLVRFNHLSEGVNIMKRIHTLETRDIAKIVKNCCCGECKTSCQSACKTSCGVANQKCENTKK